MNATAPSILVVDDDVDTCQNLADILGDLGYDVDTAHDGPSALQLAERKPYALALLDLNMPGMDGLTLYRRLREVRAGTVSMIVTAHATPETTNDALDAGAWKVLSKPVDFSRLLPLVDEVANQPLVLVVDDDQDLCHNLWDVLREQGLRVSVAHSADAAAAAVVSELHKLVLLDMKLPEGDARNLFRQIRAARPESRILIITGHRGEMEQIVEQVIAEGADAVCYKPFDVPQLLERVQDLCKS